MGRHHPPLAPHITSVAKGTQSRMHPGGHIAVQERLVACNLLTQTAAPTAATPSDPVVSSAPRCDSSQWIIVVEFH